jgi:hypothetical protein
VAFNAALPPPHQALLCGAHSQIEEFLCAFAKNVADLELKHADTMKINVGLHGRNLQLQNEISDMNTAIMMLGAELARLSAAPASAAAAACVGMRVVTHGLLKNPDLNGKFGTIVSVDPCSQRAGVWIDNHMNPISVKCENLMLPFGTSTSLISSSELPAATTCTPSETRPAVPAILQPPAKDSTMDALVAPDHDLLISDTVSDDNVLAQQDSGDACSPKAPPGKSDPWIDVGMREVYAANGRSFGGCCPYGCGGVDSAPHFLSCPAVIRKVANTVRQLIAGPPLSKPLDMDRMLLATACDLLGEVVLANGPDRDPSSPTTPTSSSVELAGPAAERPPARMPC